MKETSTITRVILAVAYTIGGIGFFFGIIGVFGMSAAVVSLLLFIGLALISMFRTRERPHEA